MDTYSGNTNHTDSLFLTHFINIDDNTHYDKIYSAENAEQIQTHISNRTAQKGVSPSNVRVLNIEPVSASDYNAIYGLLDYTTASHPSYPVWNTKDAAVRYLTDSEMKYALNMPAPTVRDLSNNIVEISRQAWNHMQYMHDICTDNYSASDDYRNEIALQGDYGRVIEQASAVLSSSDYMIFISRAKKAIMATDYLNRYYRDCFVIDFNSAKDNIENKLKSKDEQEMDESER